jgi:hypothetical protein
MSEQGDPERVTVRCWQCHRHWGPAPVLAVLDHVGQQPGHKAPEVDDGWEVWLARRFRRATKMQDPYMPPITSAGGRPHGERRRVGPVAQPNGPRSALFRLQLNVPAAQLICNGNGCTARPRESRAALVKLAGEALERGEHTVYV